MIDSYPICQGLKLGLIYSSATKALRHKKLRTNRLVQSNEITPMHSDSNTFFHISPVFNSFRALVSLKRIIQVSLLVFLIIMSGCSRRMEPATDFTGERVVSLAPNLTEIICAIGAESRLVGRTSACDYPRSIVNSVPVVGGFGKPSLDRLIRVKPTIVIDTDLEDENIGKVLEQFGLKRKRVKCSNLSDIPQAILTIGNLLHYEESARVLSNAISNRIKELQRDARNRNASSNDVPSIYMEIWGDPLMTVGRQSFVSELIALAGGRNIGDEVGKDYFPVSSEWVISRDPHVILCLYMTSDKTIRDRVADRIGWSKIKAVQNYRVYGGLDNNLILRPGPRVLEGIELLRQCITGNP